GRTADIEWMYKVVLLSNQKTSESFQSANHNTRPFQGKHLGAHPVLLTATLNNVFADAGQSAVLLRPVPSRVDLSTATRESVMDGELWVYSVMTRELAEEGKLHSTDKPSASAAIDDPRSYLYVEGHLTLANAAVAAVVEDERGTAHSSSLGYRDLTVARN